MNGNEQRAKLQMTNLIETADQLKGLSDQQLLGASHNPPPNTPGWLILSEMERRKTTRAQFQSQQQQQQGQQPPVMQQLQQSLGGGAQQGIPGQMTPQAPRPVASGAGIPPMPQAPKLMRRGGLMRRAPGGLTGDDSDYDNLDPSMGEAQTVPVQTIGGGAAPVEASAPERLSTKMRRDAKAPEGLEAYVAQIHAAAGGAPNYSQQQQILAQQLLHIQNQKPRLGDYLIRAGAAMAASPSHFLGQAAGQGLMSALDYSDKQKLHQQSEVGRLLNEQMALSRLEQGDRRQVGTQALGMQRIDQSAYNQAQQNATREEGYENQVNRYNQQDDRIRALSADKLQSAKDAQDLRDKIAQMTNDRITDHNQAMENRPLIGKGSRVAAVGPVSTVDPQQLDMVAMKLLAGQPVKYPMSQMPVAWKRAAEIAKERGMTAEQALAEGNAAKSAQSSLQAVQKQYSMMEPFANMAEKNATILEEASKKIPDMGSSLLNTPVRALGNMFGSTDITGYRAALQPVQADFAKILSSPTGAGVLTDSARKEMEAAISPGATVGQIKRALDVFRRDAQNRRTSYKQQIEELGKMSVFGGTNGGSGANKRSVYNPATGQLESK